MPAAAYAAGMTFSRILAVALVGGSLQAGEPVFEWVAAGGGAKSDKTRAVAVDQAGNVWQAGETTEDGVFGGLRRTGLGSTDFFLAKTAPDGRFLWVRSLGGSLIDRGYGVAVDAAGNAYVTGHYQSQDARANGELLPNAGDYDIFTAKYDADGRLLWLRTAGGKGYDYGHGIALDSRGDVVITGAVAGEARFGESAANAGSSARAIFCAKYSAAGELRWVKTTSGNFSGSGHGIGVDGRDNLYIGGSGGGTGAWGGLPIAVSGGQAGVVLKLDREGAPVWAATVAGKPSAGFHEITVDAAGRVWGAGMFKGRLEAGALTPETTGVKDSDGFLAHFTADGRLAWTQVVSGPGTDYCLGVATDGSGRVFVTGEFSARAQFAGRTLDSLGATDIYTAALDAQGGLEWLLANGGPKGDNAYTMTWHPQAGLVIAGACAAPAAFGSARMESPAGAEAYAAKLRWR